MKVFVLYFYFYDITEIVGVFGTKKKAEDAAKEKWKGKYSSWDYQIDSFILNE